jgi:hypothetical protein
MTTPDGCEEPVKVGPFEMTPWTPDGPRIVMNCRIGFRLSASFSVLSNPQQANAAIRTDVSPHPDQRSRGSEGAKSRRPGRRMINR